MTVIILLFVMIWFVIVSTTHYSRNLLHIVSDFAIAVSVTIAACITTHTIITVYTNTLILKTSISPNTNALTHNIAYIPMEV